MTSSDRNTDFELESLGLWPICSCYLVIENIDARSYCADFSLLSSWATLGRPRNVGWWRNHTRRDGSATCAQTLSSDLNFWGNQLASMRADFNNHLCWCITLVEWRLSFNSYVSCRGDLLFRTMNVEPDDRNERNVGNLLCVYQISKMYGLRFCLLPASKRPWISNLCFLFLCFFFFCCRCVLRTRTWGPSFGMVWFGYG